MTARPAVIAAAPPANWELSAESDWAICQRLLPLVSRTFALSIRMLPRRLSRPVSIAYLVCRIADTVEDDSRVDTATRARLLEEWRSALVSGAGATDAAFEACGQTAEEQLVLRCRTRVLGEFGRLPAFDRDAIARWSSEMIVGMIDSLPGETAGTDPRFETTAELERYCYYVAGTVGHLLTDLFIAHSGPVRPGAAAILRANAVNFGLGLQFTNVIRDAEADRDEFRVWVPAELWRAGGIGPSGFFRPPRARESWVVLEPLIHRATALLDDAFVYATQLPVRAWRVRWFCFTQMFFARRTLALIWRNRVRGIPTARVKMRRSAVYAILVGTLMLVWSNRGLSVMHRRLTHG